MSKETNGNKSTFIGRIVCIVIVVLFLPLLIVNLTLIIKGMVNPDTPPDFFGYMPLAVLSGSMDDGSDDCIKVNDMIFVKKADPQTFEKDDIITFRYSDEVITHRIVEVIKEDDKIVSFSTKGDANNTTDGLIPVEDVYGIYEGSRIGGLAALRFSCRRRRGSSFLREYPFWRLSQSKCWGSFNRSAVLRRRMRRTPKSSVCVR